VKVGAFLHQTALQDFAVPVAFNLVHVDPMGSNQGVILTQVYHFPLFSSMCEKDPHPAASMRKKYEAFFFRFAPSQVEGRKEVLIERE
jgi:hypothetical protein